MKLDYTNYHLEGGCQVQLSHSQLTNDSLPLYVDFTGPGDFYNTQVYHQFSGNSDLIFDAGVYWMGKGEIKFPTAFDSSFARLNAPLPFPEFSRFQFVNNGVQEQVGLSLGRLWSAISGLRAVEDYLYFNKRIGIFLYAPTIGLFDPRVAKWIVFLSD